ncbi:3-hydroxyacyl-CoA dehydrogenase family protein, partial [Bifidobacterium sp. H1HS16N]
TGSPVGPFGAYDAVGLRTIYNIIEEQKGDDPDFKPFLEKVRKMLDEGKTGSDAGHGFYDYPNPRYKDEDFLKA